METSKDNSKLFGNEIFKHIIENSGEAILLTNTEGTIQYANPEACKMFGRTNEEICKIGRSGIVDLNDPRLPIALEERKKTGKYKGELSFIRKNGAIFPGELSSTVFKDEDGLESTSMIIRDISERKKSEEALRVSEEIFSKAFQVGPAGMTITRISDGKFINANESFCRMFEYELDEVIGHTSTELNMWSAEERSKLIQRQIESRGLNNYELIAQTKSGKPINLLFSSQPMIVKGESCHITTMVDITERKQAEEALKKSEQDFRILAESMPQIVWVTRPDGWNIYFNQQWVDYTGMTLEESYGHGWNKPFHPDDQQLAWDAWENATQNRGTYSLECRLRRFDGEYRWWLIRGVPFINEKGEIQKWFGTCTDIEEIKQAENALKESESKFKAIVEFSPLAIYSSSGIEQNAQYINPAFYKIFGYSYDDVPTVGQWWIKAFPDEKYRKWVMDEWQKNIEEANKNNTKVAALECVCKCKDGTQKIISWEGRNIGNQFWAFGLDLTDRIQSEEALHAKHELFRKTFNISPLSSVLTKLPERTIVEVNPAFEKLFGYKSSEIIGKSVNELELWVDTFERERVSQILLKNGKVNDIEFIFKTKSGQTGYGIFYSEIIEEINEKYVLTKVMDITERKLAEAARQKFVMLADSSSEFIGMCDLDLKPFYVNPAGMSMVGLPNMAAACRVKVQDYFFPEDQRFIAEEFFPRVLREGHGDVEIRLRHFQTGEPILMFYYLFCVRDVSGDIVGWATVSRDISERRQAEEKLINYREQLEQLNIHLNNIREEERAMISREIHDELGQSLTALKIDINTIREKTSEMTEVNKKLESMTEVVSETIKNVQRISSELRPGILDDLGVGPAIEWYCEEFEKRTGIKCITNIEEVRTTNNQKDLAIYRLLQESLTNVTRHSKAQKAVIRLFQVKDNVKLEVEDDGIGFDTENIKYKNSLGLFGMQERVKQFSGNIKIESRKNKGTKISVLIPIN